MPVVRAKTSFRSAAGKGQVRGRFIQEGDILDESDPVVKRHPDLFEDPEATVERMTAAPGEKRHVVIRKAEPKKGNH